MKKLVIVMLALAASLAADYSGIWNGKGTIQSARYAGGVPYTVQITLLQAGSSLTGTMRVGKNPSVPITTGTVSGTSIIFAAGATGSQVTAHLSANGNQLTGTMTLTDGEVFTVAFTKY